MWIRADSGFRGVQGDIRHLEMFKPFNAFEEKVQGDIRHLEKLANRKGQNFRVQGDIRHLENSSRVFQA